MAFKGFVILRQEGGSEAIGGSNTAGAQVGPEARSSGLVKVVAPKEKTAENAARWSGSVETAKVVMVETTGTAAEARQNVAAMFPGFAASSIDSVTEATFLES